MRRNFSVPELEAMALQIRRDAVTFLMQSGLPFGNGPFSATELVTALFFNELNYNAAEPDWKHRDIVLFSRERIIPVIYSAFSEAGFFAKKELVECFGGLGQSDCNILKIQVPGIEIVSLSGGQDLAIAIGAAFGFKLSDALFRKVFCLTSDAEHQEGFIWEAAAIAAHNKLDNLCNIIDCNNMQTEGNVEQILKTGPLAQKYSAFGWNVIEISDGHDFEEILKGFEASHKVKGKPTAIIAKTQIGHGISFMEGNRKWYNRQLTLSECEAVLADLGTNEETMVEYLLNG